MQAPPVATFLLSLLTFCIGGSTPMALALAVVAPVIVQTVECSDPQLWLAAVVVYVLHGGFLEIVDAPKLQANVPFLPLRTVIPRVALNLASAFVLACVRSAPTGVADVTEALLFLLLAVVGNEVIYFSSHRILHLPRFYKYHAIHHAQRAPRAAGAAYCSLVEMWVANLSSFVLPLAMVRAPSSVFALWLVAGVMGTQMHHCGKKFSFCVDSFQPDYHDEHHRIRNAHYGNLSALLSALNSGKLGDGA